MYRNMRIAVKIELSSIEAYLKSLGLEQYIHIREKS